MATTYLTRTFGTETNRKIWTWSAWVKRQKLVGNYANALFAAYENSSNRSVLRFNAHQLNFQDTDNSVEIKTNRLFRDLSAWYHIVVRVDTTQGTASNRVRMYVNGVQETSFATATYPDLNDNMKMNANCIHYINGRNSSGSVDSIADMSYSHIHFADGQSYAPTVFGETDTTTGEWKIKTDPSFTLGNNGFTILKDGNTITDQSSNSNNFTVGAGTLTKTEDCPSSVFATMNLLSAGSDMAFTYGNTGIRNDAGAWNSCLGTLAPGIGKYYWEVYVHGGGDNNTGVSLSSAYGGNHSQVDAGRVVYSRNGYIYREGLSGQSNYATGVTYGDGDYIGVAFDTENGVLTFYKNGTAVSNGSTTDTSFLRSNNEYIPQCGLYNGGEFRFNFGNGAFGSTQLTGTTYTGAGSNGIFKYTVPTGFTALSTKGLNL